MNALSLSLVLVGVLLNALAQLALKASVRDMGAIELDLAASAPVVWRLAGEPWLWLGLTCYAVSVVVWILALSRVDVSVAYPMLSLGYVVNAVAAWAWFGEALGLTRLLGIGVIILGVFILARA
jgi:multidrug transporter EmrE-like cation transporter